MLTPRRIVMAARLGFALAALGMAVLMLGPFQGLEQVFGLNDKAAHVIAFYGVASGLFLIAPNQRRDDLALYIIAAAFGADAFVRFSFATSMEVIEEGMERIRKALAALR